MQMGVRQNTKRSYLRNSIMRSQPLREQEHKALKGHVSGFHFETGEICCNLFSTYGVVRHLDFIFLKVMAQWN